MTMQTLSISFHATVSRFHFFDSEKATTAYTKAKTALEEYQRYKNDRAETVEIDTEGGPATLKLERIDAVSLSDDAGREEMMRHYLSEEVIGRRLRNEMGLPELPHTPQGSEEANG
jgi:membrane-bound ClpP family serine protease